jgi:hypothetical protein
MHFQFEVPPPSLPPDAPPAPGMAPDVPSLLQQLLDVQREQLALQRQSAAAHDATTRWRAFLARWQNDFPGLPDACRTVLPMLERAYVDMIAELTDHLNGQGNDALDNEFALGEFLDRYGMKLGQLGAIVSLLAPLAEAANPPSSPGESAAQ